MTTLTARNVLLLAVLLYMGVIAWFSPLVLQDYPNHVARALIMEDLIFHHGAVFGSDYQYHFLFTPYVLGDLMLAGLVAIVGLSAASVLWAMLTFLSLPLSLLVYLRARRTSPDVTVLMLFVSLYLSTDTFFVMGFTEFKLSIAVVFLALAIMELLRQRWSLTRYAAFVLIVIASYLTHLAATVFIGAAIGAPAVWRLALSRRDSARQQNALAQRHAFRPVRITHEILLILPIAILIARHQLVAVHFREPTDLFNQFSVWGTPQKKLQNLTWDLLRYNLYQELAVVVLLVALLVFAFRERFFGDGSSWKGTQVFEPWAYAALYLFMYVALPYAQTEASYIDVRTLALLPVFILLGVLNLPRRATSTGRVVYYLAIALVAVNLAILTLHLRKDSRWIAHYREVVAKIPEHSRVLPIYTSGRFRYLFMYLHAGSFAVMDRDALIPYQFSGNLGSPMKYFRYRQLPYAPSEFWYHEGKDATVDWHRISETYDYALIMKPFSPERIPLQGHIVTQNDAVELLALDRPTR